MRPFTLAMLSFLVAACAATPPATPTGLFADSLFAPPTEPIDAARVFAASESMKRYLATEIGMVSGGKGRQRALVNALNRKDGLKLEYDAAFTRNAAEAFEARTGNCLSLVIMTAALASQMGVEVRFQSVHVDETWSRSGDLQFFSGHVNLALGGRPPELGSNINDGEQIIIDFLPPPDLRGLRWRVIDERTILAMYMNNRAAESIAAGRLDDAYWFAREAIRQDPRFASSFNTLGVIYGRKGHPEAAAFAFGRALESAPGNTRAMSNLVPVLASLGRTAEAEALQRRLRELEPEPPFSLLEKGLLAMRAGEYAKARDLFAREVERDPTYHEFHYWLAAALAQLGEAGEARQQLALAIENSASRKDAERYAGKLARLKQARRP